MSAMTEKEAPKKVDLGDGSEVLHLPRLIPVQDSCRYFDYLNHQIPWNRPSLCFSGRSYPLVISSTLLAFIFDLLVFNSIPIAAQGYLLRSRWRIDAASLQWVHASCSFMGWIPAPQGNPRYGDKFSTLLAWFFYFWFEGRSYDSTATVCCRSTKLFLGALSIAYCWIGTMEAMIMLVGIPITRSFMDLVLKLLPSHLVLNAISSWRRRKRRIQV